MKKKILKTISLITAPILILVLITSIYLKGIPNTIYTNKDIPVSSMIPVGSTINKVEDYGNKYQIKLLGLIPVKSLEVQKVQNLEIYPGGNSVGVRVSTQGVLVVGYSDIVINNVTEESPGKLGGVQLGDIILKINGEDVENCKDLVSIIKDCKECKIKIDLLRHNEKLSRQVELKKEENSDYKLGLWIRDSTAGVGTMTFIDGETKKFGALGHPITDCDTNEAFLIKKGDLLESSIISLRRGEKGSPGELKGVFINENNISGKIKSNTESGIFGTVENMNILKKDVKPMKVGFRNEICEGKASIITTIDESGPKEYEIEIVKLLEQNTPGPKSMVIKVTDPKLLEKTGGIVQGMSGSPIIQNNKIVGAVTHVLINKPDTGYGIYIEWMLKDAEIIK
ncbi:SpoIVB peptidase [Clostridium botulinum]|uniref:SpoIVB peptidase n=1 Tax=Clostridium botulinum TaxID=1491 RepID=UPI0013C69188|nr:SpoIVB peptidase [Clostridium botulinum]MBN1042556.1 SpoIVB peptidase [Clostridium botulinum]MBY6837353.1 SpoIVB peptidase [Clostridium botulinum]MBY6916437.1 SpoIVB peptidase [Clostridium botulinum]NFG63913.1 SpoIVB peptidase [Clostridium botulinum]NFN18684.1 SpoIVB peptidase [Clostridium botulinum]